MAVSHGLRRVLRGRLEQLIADYEIPPELLDYVLAAGRVDTRPRRRRKARCRPAGAAVWLFQANPSIYDIDHALSESSELTWVVRQYTNEVHKGDRVYLWRSGQRRGRHRDRDGRDDPAVTARGRR